MLKFLIILAAWVTLGVLLFLYLLWISKRRQVVQFELPLTQPASSSTAKDDPEEPVLSHPVTAAPMRRRARG